MRHSDSDFRTGSRVIDRRRSRHSVLLVLSCLVATSTARACENDGIPGYNHATGQIDLDPYAGAYAEAAGKVAHDQREAALERARSVFLHRFGLVEAADAETAPRSPGTMNITARLPSAGQN